MANKFMKDGNGWTKTNTYGMCYHIRKYEPENIAQELWLAYKPEAYTLIWNNEQVSIFFSYRSAQRAAKQLGAYQ